MKNSLFRAIHPFFHGSLAHGSGMTTRLAAVSEVLEIRHPDPVLDPAPLQNFFLKNGLVAQSLWMNMAGFIPGGGVFMGTVTEPRRVFRNDKRPGGASLVAVEGERILGLGSYVPLQDATLFGPVTMLGQAPGSAHFLTDYAGQQAKICMLTNIQSAAPGVGTRLTAALMDDAQRNGYTGMLAQVNETNLPMRAVLSKFGGVDAVSWDKEMGKSTFVYVGFTPPPVPSQSFKAAPVKPYEAAC